MPVLTDDPLESGVSAASDSNSSPHARDPAPTLRDVKPRENGGPPLPEPTRYGDWEVRGRCIDF